MPGADLHRGLGPRLDRRTFLVASGVGFCGLDAALLARAKEAQSPESPSATQRRKAKSCILVWLSGGVSQLDTWDMKPKAPAEYRGPFGQIATTAPGIDLCEHLPKLAQQAHHLAVVRSLGHFGRGTGDHHAGYYYNLTGHHPDPSFPQLLNARTPRPDDWPFIGSVVNLKRPPHPYLPSAITLPQIPGAPSFTRPGQFAARIGVEFDPLYVIGNAEKPLEFSVPALALEAGMNADRLGARRGLLGEVDLAAARVDAALETAIYSKQQERAFSLLGSPRTKEAFDVSGESPAMRERYGETINGMSMLLARRLVEAEVPFVSVFWQEDLARSDRMHCASGGGWDTHGNNFVCLKDWLMPEFDQCFSALLADLADRGLLDDTLVFVTSEMGRTPKIGDPRSGGAGGAGRDHWTHSMSVLMAGGGVRGGQIYGSTDKLGEFPADRPVAPEDIAKTVYHSLGIDDLAHVDREGRPFDLLPEGSPILGLY